MSPSEGPSSPSRARAWGRALLGLALDAGRVALAWSGLFLLESLLLPALHGPLFAGAWEVSILRRHVVPIGIAAVGLFVVIPPLVGRLVRRAVAHKGARALAAALAAAAGGWTALGVSTGRHMERGSVRAAFVAAVALTAAALAAFVVPRVVRAVERGGPRREALAWGGLGLATAAGSWLADATVLPHLYPAFHDALFALTLAGAALSTAASRPREGGLPGAGRTARRLRAAAGLAGLAVVIACALTARAGARRVATAGNLRMVALERGPLLGRAVLVASRLSAAPADDEPEEGRTTAPGEVPRALDWSGRDIVLLTVDALRADHVSSYGYPRPTTPNLDALAREGARFEAAYCATPHTSYSVASLMTGKYLRPLLALGLGEDSETWATGLRRYGWRTAAFYPPAVFFIDEQRFAAMRDRRLDFEYAKVEFTDADKRAAQVARYLAKAPADRPVFLWVHFFEPHEPYVAHPDVRSFGDRDVDRYDGEIAAADAGIGQVLGVVRAARPNAVVILTADHGEEFDDHGGRYHGTTVYDEQVRVPMVIAGPGVRPAVHGTVVQTIDLLPTVLSALGIPRPARVRGRDLGPVLAGREGDAGFAFAESDDYALVASGPDRLVCARRAGICGLYGEGDPGQRRDRSGDPGREPTVRALRGRLRGIEREHGRFESGGAAPAWPEALRRGAQGEGDAAVEVASLLDDASVEIRRKAAEITYRLHAREAAAQARRALSREEDETARRFVALALVRMGEPPVEALIGAAAADTDVAWRRRAALARAERGDPRGEAELAAWWATSGSSLELDEARELLAALGRIRAKAAVPALVRSLGDVRLRARIAETLGQIGDASAKGPLLEVFGRERYVNARAPEARALLALGARAELMAPLARFAGVPEPLPEVLELARDAALLEPRSGGAWRPRRVASPDADGGGSARDAAAPVEDPWNVAVVLPRADAPLRLLVLAQGSDGPLAATMDGQPVPPAERRGDLYVVELGKQTPRRVSLSLRHPSGPTAVWIVARAEEIEPPPPEPWLGPTGDPDP